MKRGFTLVELSIVLVIIGLLIGGILVAQSMIEATKIQSQIRQFEQMTAAIKLFELKYNRLPGDSPYHSAAGDGDGKLENTPMNAGSITYSTPSYTYEIANFWPHLQQDGFLTKEYGTFSNDASSGAHVGTHFPKAIIGGGKTGIAIYASNGTTFGDPRYRYYLANFEASSSVNLNISTTASVATVAVADMFALDTKIDDGYAYVNNWTLYTAGLISTSSVSSSCYTASGTHWKYSPTTGANCYFLMSFRDGINN
ncbi:MAG: hypothetical protein COV36_06065 [Alphaproteobacteria bacterium CG11_big_fil_rev_8_21_14_0_20_44_7]|nr:MAG: hypothetical protein COV36_06065 [Alphaproteobacteria bacterium CG11_big_fil_rev_8_21_14_0_20_44_7]